MTKSTDTKLPPSPSTWTGAFDLYQYSKQAVSYNLETILLLCLLDLAVGGGFPAGFRVGGGLLGFLLGCLVTAALTITYLASLKRKQLAIGEALNQALAFWLKTILLNLLVALSLIGSLILLVVPFFFVLPRLVLANYFLIDKKMEVMEAYKASWHATEGHATKAWGIILANVAMALLMITIVGIPFAFYFLFMYSAAFAVFYKFVTKS